MPTLFDMVKQAVIALGGSAKNREIKDYIASHFGHTNQNSINDHINSASVNLASRVNYPENQTAVNEPREKYDFLFFVGRGKVRLYDRRIHGSWGIKTSGNSYRIYRPDLQRNIETLEFYHKYSREEVAHIFDDSTQLNPMWSRSGIISLKPNTGDFVFFVTIPKQNIGKEWIGEDGIMRWHSQAHQKLTDPMIDLFRKSFQNELSLYLFIRTDDSDRRYYYAGTLNYKSIVQGTSNPVFFNWKVTPWPPQREFFREIVKELPISSIIETQQQIDEEEEELALESIRELPRGSIGERLRALNATTGQYITINGKQLKRDQLAIALIKEDRGHKCQICETSIKKKNGGLYVEGAHIKAKVDNGSELPSNILILCPNHHKEFDYGNREILEHTDNFIKFKLNGHEHNISLFVNN